MKILYITTIGSSMEFFRRFVEDLIDEGHTVDIATNESERVVPQYYRDWGCNIYQISCVRAPFSAGNLRAIGQIKKIVAENKYDIVHCHTPIASMCARLACRTFRKNGLQVFYTAHGFHFYKGAPLKNWLLYYPIEKLCSYFTDTLITINHEDYELAQKHMKAKRVEYVPGVGLDVRKFGDTVVDREAKRLELGVPEDAFLLASVGELNTNKNHEVIIRAIAKLNNEKIHYVIAGRGPLEQYLHSLSEELGIAAQVHLLGYRNDVAEIYKAADVFCFPSFREGLPVSVMEAMAAGLPVVASMNRGTIDLICDDESGLLTKRNSPNEYAEKIQLLHSNGMLRKKLGEKAQEIIARYDYAVVNKAMMALYMDASPDQIMERGSV